MSYSLNIYLNYIFSTELLITKILHECLDGIRTVPSNGKIMLIVKNMLGQETLYSTHSPKNGYYSQFAFLVRVHIIVIVMAVIS